MSSTHAESNSITGATIAEETVDVLTRIYLQHHLITEKDLSRSSRIAEKMGKDLTFTQILIKLKLINEVQALEALRGHGFCLPFGTMLVEFGYLKLLDLEEVLRDQIKLTGDSKIGEMIVERQLVKESDVTRILAVHMGLDYEEPTFPDCDKELLNKASPTTLEKLRFFPIRIEEDTLLVVFADPVDQTARTEAARLFSMEIKPALTSASALRKLISQFKKSKNAGSANDSDWHEPDSIPGKVYKILKTAVDSGASDIHIEPMRDCIRIRSRIDGVLKLQEKLPTEELLPLISRLKIEAGANIAERRRHQDGRITFTDKSSGTSTDLRASFYVTVLGENAVMRVLKHSDTVPELEVMGIPQLTLTRFKRDALEVPSGVILVTGPTGSGKTTTLYSCVNELKDNSTCIITAEEPVEYQVDGITQCSLDPDIGRTFAESLRHIVRQDPDVIVLGEVRDKYSAECAIQAAQTGHKVLTTFHTEDSVGGLLRLLNMEIEAFLIASTITCIVAQRLIRRICPDCKQDAPTDFRTLGNLGWREGDIEDATFKQGAGCSTCDYTGFKGRLAVFEPLILNEPVKDAILTGASPSELRRISIENTGMASLLEDGLLKAASGETTVEEVRRSLPRTIPPRSLTEIKRLTGTRI